MYTQLKATLLYADDEVMTLTVGDFLPTSPFVQSFKSRIQAFNNNSEDPDIGDGGVDDVKNFLLSSNGAVLNRVSAGEIVTVDRTVVYAKSNASRLKAEMRVDDEGNA